MLETRFRAPTRRALLFESFLRYFSSSLIFSSSSSGDLKFDLRFVRDALVIRLSSFRAATIRDNRSLVVVPP